MVAPLPLRPVVTHTGRTGIVRHAIEPSSCHARLKSALQRTRVGCFVHVESQIQISRVSEGIHRRHLLRGSRRAKLPSFMITTNFVSASATRSRFSSGLGRVGEVRSLLDRTATHACRLQLRAPGQSNRPIRRLLPRGDVHPSELGLARIQPHDHRGGVRARPALGSRRHERVREPADVYAQLRILTFRFR